MYLKEAARFVYIYSVCIYILYEYLKKAARYVYIYLACVHTDV